MSNPASNHPPANPLRRRVLSSAVAGVGALALPRLARAQACQDPHRLLADRRRPAVLRRDREGLLQGSRPRRRAAQVRRRAAGDGGDAVRPLRRQRQRHRLGQPRDRRDRAARPLQDLLLPTRATRRTCSTNSSSPRTARSRRSPSSRASASRSGPGIQNVTLCKTVLERARRDGRHGDRAADRPARRVDRRRPGRRRATRSSRPAPSAALNGTTRVLEAGVVAQYILGDPHGAVARRLGVAHHRVHQEVPGRDEEVHRGLRAAASSSCAPSPTRRAST